jgi:hypothetical protein
VKLLTWAGEEPWMDVTIPTASRGLADGPSEPANPGPQATSAIAAPAAVNRPKARPRSAPAAIGGES